VESQPLEAPAAASGAASFEAVPYEGPDGTPWPVRRVALPGVAAAQGLPQAPRVAVVELPAKGEGRGTLLFVHGLGSNLKFWRYQLDAFAAQGWRVVALDLVGYGRSDKPADFAYTMEAQAAVVHEAARALGLERPVLVGHSMGGQTALAYAQAHPGAVRALVLTAPAGFETFTAPEKAALKGAYTVERITGATEADVNKSVRLANFARWRPELEWLVEERLRVAKAPDFPSYALANVKSVAGLAENDGVREGLGRVKAPTLIVYGEGDLLIPNRFLHPQLTTADVMAVGEKGIAGARRVGLAGCGHAVQLDCPAEYNAEVARFLGTLR
jgi:pimeloyl-ACP methyl ester carboxylesterase